MKTVYDIIDFYSEREDKPNWWPCYWLGFKEYKPFVINYFGGAVCIDARCTREAIVIFEFNCPDLVWYSAGPEVFEIPEPLEDAPF